MPLAHIDPVQYPAQLPSKVARFQHDFAHLAAPESANPKQPVAIDAISATTVYDLVPYTHHLECDLLLTRRSSDASRLACN